MNTQLQQPLVIGTYYGYRYTADEIRKAFPVHQNQMGPKKSMPILVPMSKDFESLVGDEALFEKIAVEMSKKHHELWTGNWEKATQASGEIGYPSKSEADLALAGRIVKALRSSGVGEDLIHQSTEQIFNISGLADSDKWGGRPDYRTRTIQKAT